MKNSYSDIVANAKQFARQAIHETWPTAREVAKPTASMYEFDAICIDDETCPIGSVSIMHDSDADTFALVERPRPNAALIHEAEKEMRIGDLLQQIELKAMMLSMACETQEELSAAWAAVTATTSSSMRIRLHEIGGNVDEAMRAVDHFLLVNPQ
jgi:hypothetical protein